MAEAHDYHLAKAFAHTDLTEDAVVDGLVAIRQAEALEKAMRSIRTPMRRSMRGFFLSQASDPVLAVACEPLKTNLRPFSFPKKRSRE